MTTTSPITANTINTVNCQILDTGFISFINTSSDNYTVYLNGTSLFTSNGGTTKTDWLLAGAYTIRVVQQSGVVLTPTDKTFTGNVTCGHFLTTTFP